MPIREYTGFRVSCDNCNEEIGAEDYGGAMIYDDADEAVRGLAEWEWRLDGETVTCRCCIESAELEEEEASR